ncbi:MAG TPA: phosphatase [Gammaproteobacteria bacterium]
MARNISKPEERPGGAGAAARFAELGGVFLADIHDLISRLARVRALVFDWDGVFNLGAKSQDSDSGFSEADSMGTNMLRYGLWRRDAELPVAAIITGADNATAESFAAREHFHAVFRGVANKREAIDVLCELHDLEHGQVACLFDDINDLGMAAKCGARFLVRRAASPLLQDFVARNDYCDYITAVQGDGFAVRECTELMLGLMGAFDDVVHSRAAHDADYSRYFAARQAIETELRDGSAR